jgi:hypothetical protein
LLFASKAGFAFLVSHYFIGNADKNYSWRFLEAVFCLLFRDIIRILCCTIDIFRTEENLDIPSYQKVANLFYEFYGEKD